MAETVPASCCATAHEQTLPALPVLDGGLDSTRQIAFSARVSVGASPSAIRWRARPAPATYSIHFSKTTARASSHSGPRNFPTGPGDSRFLRWELHFGEPFLHVQGLFDLERSGGPCLCPFVGGPVIEPVSEPTRVISLGRSDWATRRRHPAIPVRKDFHPRSPTVRRSGPRSRVSQRLGRTWSVPEHPSRDDPSSIEGICSAKTTREQFRGLFGLPVSRA